MTAKPASPSPESNSAPTQLSLLVQRVESCVLSYMELKTGGNSPFFNLAQIEVLTINLIKRIVEAKVELG